MQKIIKLKLFVKKNINIEKKTPELTKDPIAPDKVLLGLILVNFGPFNIFPNIKPPISDDTQQSNNEKVIILKCVKFEKQKKSKQKTKIYNAKIKFVIINMIIFEFIFFVKFKNSIIQIVLIKIKL